MDDRWWKRSFGRCFKDHCRRSDYRTYGQCDPIWWNRYWWWRYGQSGIFNRRVITGWKESRWICLCRNRIRGRRTDDTGQRNFRYDKVWKNCHDDRRNRKIKVICGKQGRTFSRQIGALYIMWNRTCLSSDSKYDKSTFCIDGRFFMCIKTCNADHRINSDQRGK